MKNFREALANHNEGVKTYPQLTEDLLALKIEFFEGLYFQGTEEQHDFIQEVEGKLRDIILPDWEDVIEDVDAFYEDSNNYLLKWETEYRNHAYLIISNLIGYSRANTLNRYTGKGKFTITWSVDDVLDVFDCSEEEAQKVLDACESNHDCSVGMTWDNIQIFGDDLNLKRK